MKFLGIIPARFASTRFPGKPLIEIGGKSMIRRVYEQAQQSSSLKEVVVATDNDLIANEVKKFGGNVVFTDAAHQSGTDRCAEVAGMFPGFDAVINIQGDEPFIDPAQIDLLTSCFDQKNTEIATLVKIIGTNEELLNTNTPKVVLNHLGEAIYFSRNVIPYVRNASQENWLQVNTFYKHIGIYGYTTKVLSEITKLPVSLLESSEQLEQLRWIEHGYRIQTRCTTHESIAVDTPDDLEIIKNKFLL